MYTTKTHYLSWVLFSFTLLFAGAGSASECFEGEGDICIFQDSPGSILTVPFLLNSRTGNTSRFLGGRGNSAVRGGGPGGGSTSSIYQLEEGATGLNAGDGPVRWGAWASYSYSDYENDFSTTAFDGHTHSGLVGVDFSPWDRVVFGVALGYEDSDNDTTFNGGNEQTDGFTVAPYFAALLTDIWSIDVSFGYTDLEIDQVRAGGVTSSPDADRWFWSMNLNGVTTWQDWIFSGRVGTLWAESTVDRHVESDLTVVPETEGNLGQWSIEGEAAYSLGEWEPYARLTYEQDYRMTDFGSFPPPPNDEDNFLIAAGIRYFNMNGWSGNLEFYKRLGREDFDENTLSLIIRGEF